MKSQPEIGVDETGVVCRIDRARCHVTRQAEFAVTGSAEEIQLPALLPHQYIGAGKICTPVEVEADKRDLAGTEGFDATGRLQ